MPRRLSNIDLRLLESLVAVADTGSYTKAAEEVALTQPSVYRQIRKLEAQLGSPLVELDGKRVHLTEVGRIVSEYGRRLMLLAESIETFVDSSRSEVTGTLLVGATPASAEFPIAPALMGFHDLNSNVQFRVRVMLVHSREIDRLVADGSLDLAVHSNPTPRVGLVKELLHAERYAVMAPAGHRFASLEEITQQDLVGESLVYYDAIDSSVARSRADEWLARAEVEPHWWVSANNHILIRELVRSGAGVAITSEHAAIRVADELVVRPLADSPVHEIFTVRRVSQPIGLAAKFREYLLSTDWKEVAHDPARTGLRAEVVATR